MWPRVLLILTLLAFRRKMLYLCLSRGAGHSGLPLFVGLFGALQGKKRPFCAKMQVVEV